MEFFCCSWYRCDIKPSDFLDLPNLESISLGAYAFSQSLTTVIKGINCHGQMIYILDLRSLQTIELGWYSLFGRHGDSKCKLEMRSSIDVMRGDL